MIRSVYRAGDGRSWVESRPQDFTAALADDEGLLWVDLGEEPAERCEPILRETFGFHPLAVEDALIQLHVPKLDDWGSYLYVVLHAVFFSEGQEELVSTAELDVFLGANYLVTYHPRPIDAVDRAWAACQRDERHLTAGADHVLYRLADELVANYMPVLDGMDAAIDRLEDRIFERPSPESLQELFTIKRSLLHVRRIIAPQREVLNKLARDDYGVIDSRDRVFFRDVYDHLVRQYDVTETLRELVSGALETYLSLVNNRMNEIMKTLTVITTMFMPISFVAGFYGMNFFQPVVPHALWTSNGMFYVMIGSMALTPILMYFWMRRRALL